VPRLQKANSYQSIAAFKSAARVHSGMALNVLVGIARDKDSHPSSRVQAAIHILDRGWGKPEQTISGTGENGEITLILRQIVEVPMKTIEHDERENEKPL
jgi:hypothetical protein